MARMQVVACLVATLVVGLMCGGCRRAVRDDDQTRPRYVVTASPIDVRVGSGLCVAVDPSDPKGVWWWQPGEDCSSRSTGPMVLLLKRRQWCHPRAADGRHSVSSPCQTASRLVGASLR
jgi:hypothetical protein